MSGLLARLRRVMVFLRDPRVPKLPRFAVLVAVGYLIWPVDFLPDFLIPLGGYLDDLVLMWMTLRWMFKSGDAAIAAAETAPVPPPGPPRLPQ